MRPQARRGGTAEGGFDAWVALQKATDRKRADVIADVVGHPVGMPSVEELSYMNPDTSEDAIRRQLDSLLEVGVIRERVLDERVARDYPYKFYELTDDARALFDRNDLFPEGAWRRQYAAVEKTPRIRDLEGMPRPDED